MMFDRLRFRFFLTAVLALLLALSIHSAHADNVARSVFGDWQKVTVQTISSPVPEFAYATPVTLGDLHFGNPLPDSCRLYENNRLVGYRTACGHDEARPRHAPSS